MFWNKLGVVGRVFFNKRRVSLILSHLCLPVLKFVPVRTHVHTHTHNSYCVNRLYVFFVFYIVSSLGPERHAFLCSVHLSNTLNTTGLWEKELDSDGVTASDSGLPHFFFANFLYPAGFSSAFII